MYWGICHVRILDDLANRIKEAEQRVSVDSIYTHYSDAEKLYKVGALCCISSVIWQWANLGEVCVCLVCSSHS